MRSALRHLNERVSIAIDVKVRTEPLVETGV